MWYANRKKICKNVPGDDLVFVDAVFGVSPQQICLQEREINHNAKTRKHAKKKKAILCNFIFCLFFVPV